MIVAEVKPRTSDKKHTPNCANCDNPSYWEFSHVGNQFFRVRYAWRKCSNCMTPEEREAVRRAVITLGNMAI